MKHLIPFLLILVLFFCFECEAQCLSPEVHVSHKKNSDNSVDFNFRKTIRGTVFLSMKFDNLYNATQRTYMGNISGLSGKVFTMKPMIRTRGIAFSFSYIYLRGKPSPKFNEDFVYMFPFNTGTKVSVKDLNYLGVEPDFETPDSWIAYQFKTESQEIVTATRKGLVVDVVDHFVSDTTIGFQDIERANEILIEHADGTLARYSGFKEGSIKVKEGQIVYPHNELGLTSYDKNDNKHHINFCIYYLNIRNTDYLETPEAKKNMYAYINPYFQWKGGESIIEPGNDYVAESFEEQIVKEFTRREKKKFLKGELK